MVTSLEDLRFIAEISGNHLGSLKRAHDLIDAAADAGANYVKFQTYTADTMTLDLPDLRVIEGHELWGGQRLYELYKEAMTPWEWHSELFEHVRQRGMTPFSSPFDISAVEFLENLDVSLYKIASLETSDHELIRTVAQTGKPVIISTGATYFDEITELVEVFRSTGNQDLTLLVCTSSYPAVPEDAHIKRLELLNKEFNVKVGLSDHTLGLGVSVAAIALGASTIEKHLTLRRADGGADAAFSMEPEEFAIMVRECKAAFKSLGSSNWSMQKSETESRRLRRSLYVVKDVSAGEEITRENLRAIRPGLGVSPKYLGEFIGKRFAQSIEIGTPMRADFAE